MRISLAYNLRTEESEDQGELLTQEDVDRLVEGLESLAHLVTPVEVTGTPDEIVDRLLETEPDLVFNVAEGLEGATREAFYPGVYEVLGLPYTGGNCALLFVDQDKHLTEHILEKRGIRVPKGAFLTPENRALPEGVRYPLIAKPNYEGSSKGITQDSLIHAPEDAERVIDRLLAEYPEGLRVEEFIVGRELSVPMLERFPGQTLPIVEHCFKGGGGGGLALYDYAMKHDEEAKKQVEVVCPARLSPEEEQAVLALAQNVFTLMKTPDVGRVDIRLHEDGTPYFLEMNPLPSMHPDGSLMVAARQAGLERRDVLKLIVASAARRYNLPLYPPKLHGLEPDDVSRSRPTAREIGIQVGRFPTGPDNAITDVKGVQVGHVTQVEDHVLLPGSEERSAIRTGVTAILPTDHDLFYNHLVAGGFVLNGTGELSGLMQVLEWGWLETPILLTNTMSVGEVHSGVVNYMLRKYPELGAKADVIIPVVGETNDSFLNEIRLISNTSAKAIEAIHAAKPGPVAQGSVGAGTGMTTFDFAGGLGTSSRMVEAAGEAYTVGVLVQSNFGKMRNLTVDGAVVGRELDGMFPYEGRRSKNYGSIIVVIATDAPLLSSQLNRLSLRASLGLGRVGSHAAATSGEIVVAFSTANRRTREQKDERAHLDLKCIAADHINPLYEAVIEATEEAVLNAIFCSNGMTGRFGRYCPPVPHDTVIDLLRRGREIKSLKG